MITKKITILQNTFIIPTGLLHKSNIFLSVRIFFVGCIQRKLFPHTLANRRYKVRLCQSGQKKLEKRVSQLLHIVLLSL